MSVFKAEDRVRIKTDEVLPLNPSYHKGDMGTYKGNGLFLMDDENLQVCVLHEEQARIFELIRDSGNMTYILRYTDHYYNRKVEEFDSKEGTLEFIEKNEKDIDFDETVEVLEVSKTFNVERTNKYKLVEE